MSRATPLVAQLGAAECGAACLASVLGHFGRWVALEEVRAACGVSRNGSRAGTLVRAARANGLEAEGYRIPAAELAMVPTPFIAHWEGNHFVVVDEIGPRGASVNDPAHGRRRLSQAEFERGYSGTVLTFAPGPDFRPFGARPSLARALIRRLSGSRAELAFLALLGLVLLAPALIVPTFSRIFVDGYLVQRYESWLQPLVIGIIVVGLVQGLLSWMQQRLLLRLETKLAVETSGAMLHRLLRLPLGFFAQRSAAEVAARLPSADTLASLLAGQLGTTLLALPSLVFFAIVMVGYDAQLGGLALLIGVANLALLHLTHRRTAERNVALTTERIRVAGAGTQGLASIDEVRANGAEGLLIDRILGLHAREQAVFGSLERQRGLLQAMQQVLMAVAMAAVLCLGALQVIGGQISVGVLVAVQALLMGFFAPLGQLALGSHQVQGAQGALAQIDDVLDHPPAAAYAREDVAAPGIGALGAEQLTFRFSLADPPAVSDVSLSVEPGRTLAIVGASGSGKSTLAMLLAGLEEPQSGRVCLDGTPLAALAPASLRRAIALVGQETHLFEGTVRDNIAMWDPTCTEERIAAAARIAGIDSFILSRPGAYDSRIAEGGANLSGGQRAQLEIARAVAADPAVLILDEATSALDEISEAALVARLRELGGTRIVVAHRISTVREADEILVMDQGAVVERGSHQALLGQGGLYKHLADD
jgi:NHLM bacteriocin system ABC transporter peptidase/ATP-binding protein